MSKQAMLIDYEYCTGCRSCEIACRNEKGLSLEQYGIHVNEFGPYPMPDRKWDYSFIPVPSLHCDLCASRVAAGEEPSCVKHCLAFCISYGTLEEMAAKAEGLGNKVAIFTPVK